MTDRAKDRLCDIECKTFYELMQIYRHTPVENLKGTFLAYEAVKKYLASRLNDAYQIGRADAIREFAPGTQSEHDELIARMSGTGEGK